MEAQELFRRVWDDLFKFSAATFLFFLVVSSFVGAVRLVMEPQGSARLRSLHSPTMVPELSTIQIKRPTTQAISVDQVEPDSTAAEPSGKESTAGPEDEGAK